MFLPPRNFTFGDDSESWNNLNIQRDPVKGIFTTYKNKRQERQVYEFEKDISRYDENIEKYTRGKDPFKKFQMNNTGSGKQAYKPIVNQILRVDKPTEYELLPLSRLPHSYYNYTTKKSLPQSVQLKKPLDKNSIQPILKSSVSNKKSLQSYGGIFQKLFSLPNFKLNQNVKDDAIHSKKNQSIVFDKLRLEKPSVSLANNLLHPIAPRVNSIMPLSSKDMKLKILSITLAIYGILDNFGLGGGKNGFFDDQSINYLYKLNPMNLYGWSKHIIDRYIMNQVYYKKKFPPQWVGLKFFNVYGPNEYHKKDMKSIVCKIFEKVKENKEIFLFKSHNELYKDGEQLRDFIYVKDIIKLVGWLEKNKEISGIFNVGSGKARSFKDLAYSVIKNINSKREIKYIETPQNIRRNYQYFTESCNNKLRKLGFKPKLYSLEEGISDYVKCYLIKKDKYL